MARTTCLAAILVLLLGMAAGAQGQCVLYYEFDPPVIPSTRTDPVLMRAGVANPGENGCPQSRPQLVLQTSPPITLHDDGAQGDAAPGDGIYAASIAASVLVSALQPEDVYRRFVGFLDVLDGASRAARINVFAQIADASLPRYSIVSAADDVQHTAYLFNLVDPASFPAYDNSGGYFNNQRVAKRFYELFPDDFMFIDVISIRNHIANRGYIGLRNTVTGTYQSIYDFGADYGSAASLFGLIGFPGGIFYDGANEGYIHEMGHLWSRHWPASTMAFGLMGWSSSGGGAHFPCRLVPEGNTVRLIKEEPTGEFNDLDLYLMGFLPPDQVPDQYVLPTAAPNTIISQCDGRLYTGEVQRLTIADIIAELGPRVPDSTQAPHKFKVATIIVSPALLDLTTMSYFSYFAQRAELTTAVPVHEGLAYYTGKPFALATRGLGTVETKLRPVPNPDFTLTPSSTSVTVPSGAPATIVVDVSAVDGSYDSAVTLTCTNLPVHAACTFNPPTVTPGTATAPTTLTISTKQAAVAHLISPLPWLAFAIIGAAFVGRRRRTAVVAMVLLASLSWYGCGGGDRGGDKRTENSTPPGTYSITVAGIAGNTQHATTLTLVIR